MAGYGQGLLNKEKEKVKNPDYSCITDGRNVVSTYQWTIKNFELCADSLEKNPIVSDTWSLNNNGKVKLNFKLMKEMEFDYNDFFKLYMEVYNKGDYDIHKISAQTSIVDTGKRVHYHSCSENDINC